MKSAEAKWESQILLICFRELEYYGKLPLTLPDAQKANGGQLSRSETPCHVSAIRPLSPGHLKHFIKGKLHQLFKLPATHIPHVSFHKH